MKHKTKALILISSLVFLLEAKAQEVTNSPQNFAESAMSFFTTLNNNLPATNSFEMWTGTANLNNDRMEAEFGLDIHPSFLKGFGVNTIFRNDVTLGSLAQAQGGVGYHMFYVDLDMSAFVDVGYDWHVSSAYVAPGIAFAKMMTANTFSRISLEMPVGFHNAANLTPTYGIAVGFKF